MNYTYCECCGTTVDLDIDDVLRKGYKVYPPKQEIIDVEELYGYNIFCNKGFYALVPTNNKHDKAIVCEACWRDYGVE